MTYGESSEEGGTFQYEGRGKNKKEYGVKGDRRSSTG
jgi:hypothetical protein